MTLFAASVGGGPSSRVLVSQVSVGAPLERFLRLRDRSIFDEYLVSILNEDFGRHSFAPSRGRLHTTDQGIRRCERDDGSSDDGSG